MFFALRRLMYGSSYFSFSTQTQVSFLACCYTSSLWSFPSFLIVPSCPDLLHLCVIIFPFPHCCGPVFSFSPVFLRIPPVLFSNAFSFVPTRHFLVLCIFFMLALPILDNSVICATLWTGSRLTVNILQSLKIGIS